MGPYFYGDMYKKAIKAYIVSMVIDFFYSKKLMTYNLLCSRQGIYMNRLGGLIREVYLNFYFSNVFTIV